jgi:adenosylcobinamide kinase / adenosylcobinamide-phosphate guanylyltransferase
MNAARAGRKSFQVCRHESVVIKIMINKKFIFITGGARSGKSRFAEELAESFPGPKVYLATAQALDPEMAERIRRHQERRARDWQTLEEPLRVAETFRDQGDRFGLILLDCLTLWLSNALMAGWGEKEILAGAERLIAAGRTMKSSLIAVSNEVGLGIVPDNPAARLFRDLSGLIHQKAAREADEVYLLVSGIPLKIKGGTSEKGEKR